MVQASSLEESAAPGEGRDHMAISAEGGEAGPGRGLRHGPHVWHLQPRVLPSSSITSHFLPVKDTGQPYHSHPTEEETEAQSGQRAFLSPHSPAAAELGIRASAPLHPLPPPGTWPYPALPEPRSPLLALPSEPAAWFSPINYSRSQGPASSGYTDRTPRHLPCPLPLLPCPGPGGSQVPSPPR